MSEALGSIGEVQHASIFAFRRMRLTCCYAAVGSQILCVALLLCHFIGAQAQTLAHPGWHGNGIASQAWWKHASFVRFGSGVTFAEAANALDNDGGGRRGQHDPAGSAIRAADARRALP